MRTFAYKQDQPKERISSNLDWSNTAASGSAHRSAHRTHPLLRLQRTIGNRAVQGLLRRAAEGLETDSAAKASTRFEHDVGPKPPYPTARTTIQPKLAVSVPGDSYEQEADRVAAAVVAGYGPSVGGVSRDVQPKLYRAPMRPEDIADSVPPPGEERGAGPSVASASEEVQRGATGEAGAVGPHFEQSLQQAVSGRGETLPAPVRSFMESRLGRDFSAVQVHRDEQADALARTVNARAFTLGNSIFFARSQYHPESPEGQRLLAHELTHVVQQSDGRLSRQIQRQTSCSSYNGYSASNHVHSYNCAGLALRTYQFTSPPSAVIDAITANFIAPMTPASGSCDAGAVKFWLWEYDIKMEDDQGNVVAPTWQDFHIVAGRVDSAGNDPADVYSKNGRRPVYGPGTGPGFRPPARDRATSNDQTEQPLTVQGRPVFKVRSNMSESITCAGCHP